MVTSNWLCCLAELFRSQPVLGSLSTLLIAFVLLKLVASFIKTRGEPPGPNGLPLVGSLPFLLGDYLHIKFDQMAKKYGPVFSVKMGSYKTVVFNSYEAMKESGRMDAYTNRPHNFYHWSDTNDHIGVMSGTSWKEQRKFIMSTIRNVGMSQLKVEQSIKEQIGLCLESLKTKTGDVDVNVREMLSPATNNIIMSLICGKTFDPQDPAMKIYNDFQHHLFAYFELFKLPFFFPPIMYLYKKFNSKAKELQTTLMEFQDLISAEIKEHQKEFDPEHKKDYMDFFLDEIENQSKGSQKTSFTVPSLLGNAGILLNGGSETVRSTLEWLLLCMAGHQLIQEAIYQQIIDVLGPETYPDWKDRERLPLVHAMIVEVMRYKTLAAIPDPHWTSEDSVVCGLKIPKNTFIWLNIWGVHNDKDYWGDPENFRPDRFLSEDFKTVVNTERVIPFGIGKRNCPGEKLGEIEVFLFITSILQKFRILPPKDGLSMEETCNSTQILVHPIVRVQLR